MKENILNQDFFTTSINQKWCTDITYIHTENEGWAFGKNIDANLAKSISIEANELLECFQWDDKNFDLQHVKEELADVMVYCQDMLDALGLDEDEIINMKMDMNEKKYPVEKDDSTFE